MHPVFFNEYYGDRQGDTYQTANFWDDRTDKWFCVWEVCDKSHRCEEVRQRECKRCHLGYPCSSSKYSEKHALYDQLSNADRKIIEELDPKGCDGQLFRCLSQKDTLEGVRELLMTGLAQKLGRDFKHANKDTSEGIRDLRLIGLAKKLENGLE